MIKFYWYPRCSTCQKAKRCLDEQHIKYEAIDIVLQNPSIDEIKEYHKLSKLDIKKLFNTSGLVYKAMDLKNKLPNLSLDEQYALLSQDGKLIKRPILVTKDMVLFGFKEEEYKKIKE